MAFKVRDLMISVIPSHGLGGDCNDCTGACSNSDTDCPGGCSNADSKFHTEGCPEWVIDPGDLVELQGLLKSALARIELVGSQPVLRPRTRREADELEAKLVGALETLRAEKARLK
jgi:hypothetical protein